jgi:hypothetical protein
VVYFVNKVPESLLFGSYTFFYTHVDLFHRKKISSLYNVLDYLPVLWIRIGMDPELEDSDPGQIPKLDGNMHRNHQKMD